MSVMEGRIPFRGYHTWYRDRGPAESIPLVCLHGGPGSTHWYFESLAEELAREGRRVVVYDQLGCGSSDRPEDDELWTVDLFVDELDTVRAALGLDRLHLLGTSWGAMLALEYVIRDKSGLVSLTLNSPPTASSTWAREAARLKDELPEAHRRAIAEHEATGDLEHPAYVAAEDEFWRRHICRLEPPPEFVERGRRERGKRVYHVLWGLSEWSPDGRLRDWDVRARLSEIDLPTLITSGRYDECTPALAEEAHRGIRGSEWVLFEESSHMPFVEEPERFRTLLSEFLQRAEVA